jgi:hypothetical protein
MILHPPGTVAGGTPIVLVLFLWAGTTPVEAQQVGDTTFVPDLGAPAFRSGEGPRVVVDGAHVNFHTVDGRYGSFARVLQEDGFQVEGSSDPFTASSLEGVDLLVIANALNPRNEEDWSLPTPSAFTDEEIQVVRSFVEEGGSLLLLADHMPFPGAAGKLASAFGFELNNGFALDTASQGPLVFRRSDGSLAPHPFITGGGGGERVDSVATFTGSAFNTPPGAVTLLILPDQITSLMPEVAWEFGPETKSVDVGGWAQGAILEVGLGRVAVFGEAAMFSAQLAGAAEVPMGMNAPIAGQNAQFLVNLVRWLTRAS